MKMIANEFVIPMRDGWASHASHFAVLKDGRIFCAFFYGSHEGQDDVRVYGAIRDKNGVWGEAFAISRDDGTPHWNPVVFERNDGAYVLFYKVGKPIAQWKTFYRISTDECATWSGPIELVPGDESGGRGPVRNSAIYLSDGSILAPASTEQGEWRCFFDRSTDNGKNWERSELLSAFEKDAKNDFLDRDYYGIIQPAVWESESGVHALMRSAEEWIYRTDSTDFVHWCQPYPIDIPNNNSGIDAVRLPDGRIFLACNPVSAKTTKGARTPLSLYVSNDDGMHFEFYTNLATGVGKFAYPALRYADGRLHITFSRDYKTIVYMCFEDL